MLENAHDKSWFFRKAIETVKHFKYFKLYEFWLGFVGKCGCGRDGGGKNVFDFLVFVCSEHAGKFVVNESNADWQLERKIWKMNGGFRWKMNFPLIFLTIFRSDIVASVECRAALK